MSQPELLSRVVGVLNAAGVAYMITGSLASSLQGEPRSTHDLDLVVDLPEDGVRALLEAFPPPDYYLDEEWLMGMEVAVSSPEDTILAKLRWAIESGGSEKQFVDALRIYEVQYARLDFDYLEHWAAELRVVDLWQRLKREADVLL